MGQRIAAGTPALTLTFCLLVLPFTPARLLAADEETLPELTQAETSRIEGVPPARFRKLQRGVNTSHWFSQIVDPKGYTPEHFLTHTTVDDVALIKSLGFDHVRLSLDPAPMFAANQAGQIPRNYLEHLDRAIRMILGHDLALIVDLHPSSDFKKKLQMDDRHVEALADFWRAIARHLSAHDAERVFLEVLNEPEFGDSYRWSGVQAKLVATIRRAAPQHTIIVTGHRWSVSPRFASSVVKGAATPPAAATRSRPPDPGPAPRISPLSGLHARPRFVPATSHTTDTGPPAAATRLSCPPEKNARERLSGDQKG